MQANPAFRRLKRDIYKVLSDLKAEEKERREREKKIKKGQDKGISTSEAVKRLNISKVISPTKYKRFTNVSMANANIYKGVKGIRFDSELAGRLRKYRIDAENLGFMDRTPNRRTLSYYTHHIMDPDTKEIIEFVIKKIEEVSNKFGITLDLECLKPTPHKKTCKKTDYNIKREKFLEIGRITRKNIYPILERGLRENAIYAEREYLDLIHFAAWMNVCTRNACKMFNLINKDTTPHPSSVLKYIGKHEIEDVIQEKFIKGFEYCFDLAESAGAFGNRREFDVAIDFTNIPYYGNPNKLFSSDGYPMLMGMDPEKSGTTNCLTFASIIIVQPGIRFTPLVLPVGRMSNKEDIIRKLIEFTRNRIKIRYAYMDRAFLSGDIINFLKKINIKFVIPAKMNRKVERFCSLRSGSPYIIKDYEMGEDSHLTTFNMIVLERDGEKFPFATNIDINEQDSVLANNIPALYRKRWGIETSYRMMKDLLAKTTSRNYRIRLFYFLFSSLLYNLWVIINLLISKDLMERSDIPVITAKLLQTIFFLLIDEK